MEFKVSYFENELREDFLIPGMMKKSWASQLEILEVIKKICEKHQIKWFADYGTLLGTIRHRGFIPWDDDLDICMLQEDYIKFNEVIQEELPKEYYVINFDTTDDNENYLTRITNGQHINTGKEFLKKFHGFPYVAGVDIFPLNNLYNDSEKETIRSEKVRKIWEITEDILNEKYKGSEAKLLLQVENILKKKVKRKKKQSLVQVLNRILNDLFFECKENDSKQVCIMTWYYKQKSHVFKREYFEHIVSIPFEMTSLQVPLCYEQILKREYGDWSMKQLKGAAHEYPLYKAQEQVLEEHKNGEFMFEYRFAKDERLHQYIENKTNRSIKREKRILILEQAHHLLNSLFITNQVESALQLLAKCQEVAIDFGTQLEKEFEYVEDIITCLEEYCEYIAVLYSKLLEEEKIKQEECDALHCFLGYIEEAYKELMDKNKKSIFIVQKFEEWEIIKTYYQKLKSSNTKKVYIMPIPYYEKFVDGTAGEEFFETEKFKKIAEILDYKKFIINYKKYNLEYNDIEQIIICDPFDEYNSTTSVLPFFYSYNLKKYADEITYIPYLKIPTKYMYSEKMLHNFKEFLEQPGIFYSDRIILESEEMKKYYIDTLCTITKDIAREEWDKKIVVQEIPNKIMDIEEKYTKKIKKTILFYTGYSEKFTNSNKALEKLEETIKVFEEHAEQVEVIWKAESDFSKNLELFGTEISQRYIAITKKFIEKKLGTYEENSDYYNAVELCDAYYGAPGYLMNLCNDKKIPVMISMI